MIFEVFILIYIYIYTAKLHTTSLLHCSTSTDFPARKNRQMHVCTAAEVDLENNCVQWEI